MAMPHQDDLIAGLGSAHQLGQLSFGVGHGYKHWHLLHRGSRPSAEKLDY
jgi:hypothetical protein